MPSIVYILAEYPWVSLLVLSVQAVTIVHILRHQRDTKWVWMVMMMPLLGSLLYYHFEVGLSAAVFNPLALLGKVNAFRIRELQRKLEDSDVLDNRLELAELYATVGRTDEAYTLIANDVSGPFRDHPYLLYTLARICLSSGRLDECTRYLDRLDQQHVAIRKRERQLLRARLLVAQGDAAARELAVDASAIDATAAEAIFRRIAGTFDGEEARYHYATFLLAQNRPAEAITLADAGIAYYKRSERLYRRLERPWYRGLHSVRSLAATALKKPLPPATGKPLGIPAGVQQVGAKVENRELEGSEKK